jgi:hypothetical protein
VGDEGQAPTEGDETAHHPRALGVCGRSRAHLAVHFSDVEQVEVVLYLVELQPHLDLAAGGERELL